VTKKLESQLLNQILDAKLPRPKTEYLFHPERKWRFDFAWPGAMVAVEVEGGTWTRGRHVRPKGYAKDCYKYSEAALAGWLVIRVTGDMIRSGVAADLIKRAFETVEAA